MTIQERICVCGSMAFIDEMEALASSLKKAGYWVDTPIREEEGADWSNLSEDEACDLKRSFIDAHLAKIRASDIVLIANYHKNGIDGYIGANSLMEAAFAYALNTPVVYLKPVGEQPCRLEAISISNVVIGGDHASNSIAPQSLRVLCDQIPCDNR